MIRSSNYWEKDYRTYADTLRNILSDSTIFINGIQYDQYERLVDYTDSTGIIKSAHFRKDGQKFKNHMEESQINILNNKQMSRSGSHRYETHTKTNYENNEYIYLMG